MTQKWAEKKFALIDRDGTIILNRNYLNSPDLIEFAPGAIAGLTRLQAAGFQLLLVTNQSGIARGYFDEACLMRVHDRLVSMLAQHGVEFAKIYYCPHGPGDGCECRKPASGMVKQAMADFGFSVDHAVVIGDSIVDMQLAKATGIRGIQIGSDSGCASDFSIAAERAINHFELS